MICSTCGYDDDVKIGNGHSPASCKAARAIARAEKAVVRAAIKYAHSTWPMQRVLADPIDLTKSVDQLLAARKRAQQARRVKR